MHAMTLRLDDRLSKRFEQYCRRKGYKKTGVILSLIKNFLADEEEMARKPLPRFKTSSLKSIVGIAKLGGDSVEDTEDYWE